MGDYRQCKSERRKAEERNNAGMDGSSLVLFSIRFCRRKHNGLSRPGNVPFCEAYTIADWTPLQISIRPREVACRSKAKPLCHVFVDMQEPEESLRKSLTQICVALFCCFGPFLSFRLTLPVSKPGGLPSSRDRCLSSKKFTSEF